MSRQKTEFLFVNLHWPSLVSPKTFKIHFALPPLDLLLMHNMAEKQGHEARIFDCFVEHPEKLKPLLAAADWVIVTTTPYHMWQCPNVEWEHVREALAAFPLQKTLAVGLHGSVFPEQTLRETGVRAVFRREPEVILQHFLQGEPWEECPGVSTLQGAGYRENPLPKLPLMDQLVVHNYQVDIQRYGYFLLGKRTGIFESSRGCPWKCTFCDQEMYSWKYRTKAPEIFAEEVSRAVHQTGMKSAYFFDLEFTIARERTLGICSELIKRGVPQRIKWACQTRADMVHEDTLAAMKDAGCSLIHFGVESATPAVLQATNKKITLDKIERGVRLAKKMGFQTACFFMFGLPGEKDSDFNTTLEFARSLNPTYASFHFAVPFPGTPLYDDYIRERNLPWGVWPATYYNDWSHEEIRRYIGHAFKKFYLTPKKLEFRQFAFRLQNVGDKLRHFSSISS